MVFGKKYSGNYFQGLIDDIRIYDRELTNEEISSLAYEIPASSPLGAWGQNGANIFNINTGNVGIGTDEPEEKLHVNGKLLIDGKRPTLINTSTGSIETTANASGWTMGLRFRGYDGTDLGGWRAKGGTSNLNYYYVGTSYTAPLMAVLPNGNVGIGTKSPSYKLSVNGTIGAKEVIVTNDGWADFVFEDDYKLMSLKDLDNYIKANKHLPEIPTTAEVEKNGISVGEMNAKLLQKVEELTLYVIELQKKNEEQDKKIKQLENK